MTEFSLAGASGETVALIGESGCGKTTAALAILGHAAELGHRRVGSRHRDDAGSRADLLALPPRKLRALRWRHIAYVPQGSISALTRSRGSGVIPADRAGSRSQPRRTPKTRAWSCSPPSTSTPTASGSRTRTN